MRHGRAKQARKTLQFFARITHNRIRPPYSILLDGTFLVAVIQYKLHDEMTSRLHRLLQQHEHGATTMIHLITTRSTLVELQKLEQAVAAKGDSEKTLVFRQAREWAEANCMRILENSDIPDESTIDISAIPTTPSSVMQQQGNNNKNNKRARGGGGGGGGIGDVSLVGREFLCLTMAVLVQEDEDEAKEKSTTAAASTVLDDSTSTKEEESGTNSFREQGQWRRDGKRQNQQHQHKHGYYFVASQDEQVLDRLRHLGHVPIIRLARGSVLLLEQPSKAATQQAWREERLKWRLGIGAGSAGTGAGNINTGAASSILQQERNEAQRLVKEERQERRREQQQEQQQQQQYATRHKKRAKGPNPLSCKPGAKKKQKT